MATDTDFEFDVVVAGKVYRNTERCVTSCEIVLNVILKH